MERELHILTDLVHSVAQITIWIGFLHVPPELALISCKEV
jgi:hypothetical protein